MYLKVVTDLAFTEIAARLVPRASADELSYDYENVYEWMYVPLLGFDVVMNVSRDHGQSEETETPVVGATYFTVHDEAEIARFDRSIRAAAQLVANRLKVSVAIHAGRYFVDSPEGPLQCRIEPS